MKKSAETLGIVCLLVTAGFLGFITFEPEVVSAATINVGSGPGNDTASIKDAINNYANPGDTVYVHSGIYNEGDITINKQINLVGENRDTTIINGSGTTNVIIIENTNWVNITGFTIIQGRSGIRFWMSSNNNITGNNISNNQIGLDIVESSNNNIIADNHISNNGRGIYFLWSSNNNIITGNNISNNGYGIYIVVSSSINISNNNFFNDGIFLEGNVISHYNSHTIPSNNIVNGKPLYYYKDSSGVNIDGIPVGQLIIANCVGFVAKNLQINNTDVGIEVAFSTDINITNNKLVSNQYEGIYLWQSSNTNTTNNNVSSNGGSGIYLYGSANNYILGNNVSFNSGHGIYLLGIANSNLTDNNISSNIGTGIHLTESTNDNIISNNVSFNGGYGIHLDSSSNTNISINSFINDGVFIEGFQLSHYNSHTIPDNNIINGKPLYYYKNSNSINIDSIPVGELILANCMNIDVKNLQINNADVGIEIALSTNVLLENNSISSNSKYGIYLYASSNNTLLGNNVSNNGYGTYLWSSLNNTIANNKISSNDETGIWILDPLNNTITSNNISSNNGYGIYLFSIMSFEPSNNFIIGNNISSSSRSGIFLGSFDPFFRLRNNTITSNNIISNNEEGIRLEGSSNNNITGNNVSSNIAYGIYLNFFSDNNIIAGNNILNNENGIHIMSSFNNRIYHNNIIGNTFQAFDDGNSIWNLPYPFGGNYWSDWTTPDVDEDGFVDFPRVIDPGINLDNWPFTTIVIEEWVNKSAYPNYAPSGMPDFDQRQNPIPFWMTLNAGNNSVLDSVVVPDDELVNPTPGLDGICVAPGLNHTIDTPLLFDDILDYAYCGPTAAANGLWWLDSRYGNQSGVPGDGDDDYSLVIDLGAGDDHAANNVPLLIEDLALRFKTNETGTTNISNMVNGLNQLLLDRNMAYNHSVYNKSWPAFQFVANEIKKCNVVILLLAFYEDSGTRIRGHFVTSSGVSVGDQQIGISDPIKNIANPIAVLSDYNDALNVSHDVYNATLVGSLVIGLPPGAWMLEDYKSGYLNPIPIDHYAVVEDVVIISPNSVPDAPIGLTAIAGATYVNLTWSAPVDDGGSPITYYRIYRGTTSGGETSYIEIGNITSFNDTNVNGGVTYYYKVSAVNSVGEGPLSNETNGTPVSEPSPPINLTATAGDSYVNLTWDVPSSDGGFVIIGYNIYRNGTIGIYNSTTAGQLWFNDTDVINGVTYIYNVSAINAIGEGLNSTTSATPTTPSTVPSIPQNLQANAGNGYVNLTWNAPSSDGGSAITGYNIYRNGTIGIYNSTPAGQLWFNDTNVINGVTYTYYVSAINGIGEGSNSTIDATPTTPLTIPSTPQNLQANAGIGYVNLTWNVPSDNGGSPITNYTIYRGTITDGETLLEEIGNLRFYNDTNVTNGVKYYYKVGAKNAIGEGPLSNEVNATPFIVNQLPTCNISNPKSGEIISGNVEIIGNASDPDGTIQRVEIKIDEGNWIWVTGTTSWSYNLVTTELSNGQHTIYVRSYDGMNYSSEISINVEVDNPKEEEPEDLWWLWLLIALIIILLLIVAFLALRKKKTVEEVEEELEEEEIPPPPPKKAIIAELLEEGLEEGEEISSPPRKATIEELSEEEEEELEEAEEEELPPPPPKAKRRKKLSEEELDRLDLPEPDEEF